jgi:hypothetical protein
MFLSYLPLPCFPNIRLPTGTQNITVNHDLLSVPIAAKHSEQVLILSVLGPSGKDFFTLL